MPFQTERQQAAESVLEMYIAALLAESHILVDPMSSSSSGSSDSSSDNSSGEPDSDLPTTIPSGAIGTPEKDLEQRLSIEPPSTPRLSLELPSSPRPSINPPSSPLTTPPSNNTPNPRVVQVKTYYDSSSDSDTSQMHTPFFRSHKMTKSAIVEQSAPNKPPKLSAGDITPQSTRPIK
ncbi:hypothetical protein EDB19DRAFT_1922342 [Suillus lakei]|nr:hypothetical protein EDB19DRAFT_1922342 [Suillus lakei]